nr:hypothetical protein [Micromonospora purpureochromogenes]
MTLVFSWVRNSSPDVREMVMASDSRLSGGGARWDCCPKILSLPRSDAVLAFAGITDIAYPAMLQVQRAVEASPAVTSRRYDITQLADIVENVLNQMLDIRVVDRALLESAHLEKSATMFILGGWSWRYQQFQIWKYVFSRKERRYVRSKREPYREDQPSVQLQIGGDVTGEALREFNLLRARLGLTMDDPLDMEPFEVLRDMIRSRKYPTVGGAPQVVKVYRHMNADFFGVIWRSEPRGEAAATYGGRPLLDYEKQLFPLIDADSPSDHARAKALAQAKRTKRRSGVPTQARHDESQN